MLSLHIDLVILAMNERRVWSPVFVLCILLGLSSCATSPDRGSDRSGGHVQATMETVERLLKQKNCLACHAWERKLVGPAYHQVRARYGSQDLARLTSKVLNGGSGAWGAIPMPANTQVSQAEAELLVAGILGLGSNSGSAANATAPPSAATETSASSSGAWRILGSILQAAATVDLAKQCSKPGSQNNQFCRNQLDSINQKPSSSTPSTTPNSTGNSKNSQTHCLSAYSTNKGMHFRNSCAFDVSFDACLFRPHPDPYNNDPVDCETYDFSSTTGFGGFIFANGEKRATATSAEKILWIECRQNDAVAMIKRYGDGGVFGTCHRSR